MTGTIRRERKITQENRRIREVLKNWKRAKNNRKKKITEQNEESKNKQKKI